MPPRKSLSREQLATPAGVELLAICESVTADGKVSDDEIAALREWLEQHQGSGLPAEAMLAELVSRILEDGVVDATERRELHAAVEAALPPELRRSAVAARRTVVEAERQEKRAAKEAAATTALQRKEEKARDRVVARVDAMVAGHFAAGRPERIRKVRAESDLPTPVQLVPEPQNRFSTHAVAVCSLEGAHLGYVPEDGGYGAGAAEVSRLLVGGAQYRAWIVRYLGRDDKPIPVVKARFYGADAVVSDAAPEVRPETPGRAARAQSQGLTPIQRLVGIVAIVSTALGLAYSMFAHRASEPRPPAPDAGVASPDAGTATPDAGAKPPPKASKQRAK